MEISWVSVAVRWVHVLSAVALVGGLLFYRLVLLPALARSGGGADLRATVDARWKRLVHASIGLLLLSGLYNFFIVGVRKAHAAPAYHAWFGAKFLLALAVFLLASVLVGRAPAFARLREGAATWYLLTSLLAIGVVLLSGVMRAMG